MERRRGAFNTVIPGKIYQRGQIYTWTLDVKQRAFQELGLRSLVNLWPKVDPDLSSLELDMYIQLSCPRSEMCLRESVIQAARSVADYLSLRDTNTLILCEAGKTRSVFFCILVYKFMHDSSYEQAKSAVLAAVPSTSLKGFMIDWLKENDKCTS